MPLHFLAAEYLDGYVQAAGITGETNSPLIRKFDRKSGELLPVPLARMTVSQMLTRRAEKLGFTRIGCHSYRATGITVYRKNGGELETAAAIAGHDSTRTTQLYDRSSDEVTQQEVERIRL